MFCSAVLIFEALVVLFATLVAFGTRDRELSMAPVWIVGAVGALLCVVAAGMVRTRAGIYLGSAVQVMLLLGGAFVPVMWFIGAVFAVLWIVALRLGGTIDAERAEREIEQAEWDRAHGTEVAAGGDAPSSEESAQHH